MERLSFLDQALHKITTAGVAPVDMQGVMIVNPAKGPFEITPEVLGEHIAARLAGVPLLRKKLVQDSLRLGDMRLVDDPAFDMSHHIRYAELPAPGGQRELNLELGRFSAERLDLDRPLWRFEIISGLEDGRIAIAQKLSHATMDGMAAMKMNSLLFESEQCPPEKPSNTPWVADPEPTRRQLLAGAFRETGARIYLRAPALLGKQSVDLVSKAVRNYSPQRKSDKSKAAPPVAKPRRTSLNGAISGDQSVLAYQSFKVDELKQVARQVDCTINDLCIAMASGAFKRYFEGINETVDFDLYSIVPLSKRAAGDSKANNAIALTQVNLHNTIEDPLARLRAIQRQTGIAKAERSVAMKASGTEKPVNPVELLELLSPIVLDIVGAVLARLQPWSKIPVFTNTLITNVPGPQGQTYLAGMPIEEQIPVVPVGPTCALNVGITSMDNNLTFGFHGCGSAVEESDMHFFLDGLIEVFDQLRDLTKRPPAKRKTRPKAARTRAAAGSAKGKSRAGQKKAPRGKSPSKKS